MNRRDIIKGTVLIPFIGTAAIRADHTKPVKKITIDSIMDKIVFDKTYDDYIKSFHKAFPVFDTIITGLHIDSDCSSVIYLEKNGTKYYLLHLVRRCFDELTVQKRIKITRLRLTVIFRALKEELDFYSEIDNTVVLE